MLWFEWLCSEKLSQSLNILSLHGKISQSLGLLLPNDYRHQQGCVMDRVLAWLSDGALQHLDLFLSPLVRHFTVLLALLTKL